MSEVKMPEYPDNSDACKVEAPVPVREDESHGIISGKATRKKKSALKKASETVLADDAETIKSYLVFDVLIPAAKDTLNDLVTNALDMMLYGSSKGSSGRTVNRRKPSSGYHNKYNQPESKKKSQLSDRSRRMMSFDDIILDSRPDAEQVLDYLRRRIDSYEAASVADLYDAVDITSDWTDTKYGWYDLDDAQVRRTRDGFLLDLPRAERLD